MSHVARVGVILLVGAVLLSAILFLLSGRYAQMQSYPITVVFDNALGLQAGAKVRMAGVDVGTVGEIALTPDNRARLKLNIKNEIGIPEGSKFSIVSGALIGEKYVDIEPGNSARVMERNALVEGPKRVKEPIQVEEVASQVSQVLADAQKITANINRMLEDPVLQRDLIQTVENLARATARSEELMITAQTLLLRNQQQIDRTVTNLSDASKELKGAMIEARSLIAQPEIRSNVIDTTANLRTASERLDAVMQDVREVTGDPKVAENLKSSAENLSQATGYARDVTERISRIFGAGRPRVTINVPRPKFQSGTRLMLESAGAGSGTFRTDLSLNIPMGKDTGLRLGLYDFTENNRIIVQRINWLDPQTATRYGLYAGRVGAGMDYEASKRVNVSADLYDPKYPRLDLRGRYYFSDDFGLVLGVDGILRQPRAVFGLQWRQ